MIWSHVKLKTGISLCLRFYCTLFAHRDHESRCIFGAHRHLASEVFILCLQQALHAGSCLLCRNVPCHSHAFLKDWKHKKHANRSMNLYFCRVPPRGSFRSSKTRESPGRLCLNGAGSQDLLLGFGTGLEGITWATWCHNKSVGPWGFHPFLGVRGHQRQQQLPLLCCAWSSSFQPQTSGIPRTVPCLTQSWFRAIGQASASVQVACWCFSTEAGMTLTVFFSWTLAVWHGLCLGLP